MCWWPDMKSIREMRSRHAVPGTPCAIGFRGPPDTRCRLVCPHGACVDWKTVAGLQARPSGQRARRTHWPACRIGGEPRPTKANRCLRSDLRCCRFYTSVVWQAIQRPLHRRSHRGRNCEGHLTCTAALSIIAPSRLLGQATVSPTFLSWDRWGPSRTQKPESPRDRFP